MSANTVLGPMALYWCISKRIPNTSEEQQAQLLAEIRALENAAEINYYTNDSSPYLNLLLQLESGRFAQSLKPDDQTTLKQALTEKMQFLLQHIQIDAHTKQQDTSSSKRANQEPFDIDVLIRGSVPENIVDTLQDLLDKGRDAAELVWKRVSGAGKVGTQPPSLAVSLCLPRESSTEESKRPKSRQGVYSYADAKSVDFEGTSASSTAALVDSFLSSEVQRVSLLDPGAELQGVEPTLDGQFLATLNYQDKQIKLGEFELIEHAAKARDRALLRIKGPVNCTASELNFPVTYYAREPMSVFTAYDEVLNFELLHTECGGELKPVDFSFVSQAEKLDRRNASEGIKGGKPSVDVHEAKYDDMSETNWRGSAGDDKYANNSKKPAKNRKLSNARRNPKSTQAKERQDTSTVLTPEKSKDDFLESKLSDAARFLLPKSEARERAAICTLRSRLKHLGGNIMLVDGWRAERRVNGTKFTDPNGGAHYGYAAALAYLMKQPVRALVKQTKAVIKKAKAKLQTCAERPTTPVTAPPLAATTPDTPVNEGDPAISDAWKLNRSTKHSDFRTSASKKRRKENGAEASIEAEVNIDANQPPQMSLRTNVDAEIGACSSVSTPSIAVVQSLTTQAEEGENGDHTADTTLNMPETLTLAQKRAQTKLVDLFTAAGLNGSHAYSWKMQKPRVTGRGYSWLVPDGTVLTGNAAIQEYLKRCAQALTSLEAEIERKGGEPSLLKDWQVRQSTSAFWKSLPVLSQVHAGGSHIFISPTGEEFKSQPLVLKHMGLTGKKRSRKSTAEESCIAPSSDTAVECILTADSAEGEDRVETRSARMSKVKQRGKKAKKNEKASKAIENAKDNADQLESPTGVEVETALHVDQVSNVERHPEVEDSLAQQLSDTLLLAPLTEKPPSRARKSKRNRTEAAAGAASDEVLPSGTDARVAEIMTEKSASDPENCKQVLAAQYTPAELLEPTIDAIATSDACERITEHDSQVEPRMGANTVAKLDRDLVRELKQTNHEAPRPKRCKKML